MAKYTDEMYMQKADEANMCGKVLYVVNGELEIRERDYYICEEGTNFTDGTLNPDFGKVDKQREAEKIQAELIELDRKRIRAVCEPELKDAEEGQTWLEFYNFKIFELREKLSKLQ